MKFQSNKLYLNCIQTVFYGEVNDVYIAEDLYVPEKSRYVLWVVKNHSYTKKILSSFLRQNISMEEAFIDYFSSMGNDVFVLPYENKRPLADFYMGNQLSTHDCETVCKNLVLTFITSKMTYPILYLIIKQGMISWARDYSIYLSYEIDLKEFDDTITEKQCVIECAKIVLDLLESKSKQKVFSYTLVKKRAQAEGYRTFAELYKDVTIAAEPIKKRSIIAELKAWFNRNKDSLFWILIVICVILGLTALVALITLFIKGDVPWLRVFINGFSRIGTESLKQ